MKGYLWHEEWWPVIEIHQEGDVLATPDRCYEIPDDLVAQYRNSIRVHEEAQDALLAWAVANGIDEL